MGLVTIHSPIILLHSCAHFVVPVQGRQGGVMRERSKKKKDREMTTKKFDHLLHFKPI